MKTCIKCSIEKPCGSFTKRSKAKDGLSSWCKDCNNASQRSYYYKHAKKKAAYKRIRNKINRFSIALTNSRSSARFNGWKPCTSTVSEIQGCYDGHCSICGVPEKECTRLLSLDHDHYSGRFRGWLCGRCNNMLGMARDNPEILVNGAVYLENHVTSTILERDYNA